MRSSIARCTSSFSNTARCKLDREARPLALTSVTAFPEYVLGTGDFELSIALDDAGGVSAAGLDVKCEGTMTGVGRGGGGH